MHQRVNIDARLDAVRSMVEEDVRKDVDRQKSLWFSFMSELRVRCTRIEKARRGPRPSNLSQKKSIR